MKLPVLRGVVVRGQGLGRKLGFPTANLKLTRGRRPAHGVYRVQVEARTLGRRLGVCNVGVRPTVGGARRVHVEVHIPDFSGDLYGQALQVTFLSKIREERKFASLEELRAQIIKDISASHG